MFGVLLFIITGNATLVTAFKASGSRKKPVTLMKTSLNRVSTSLSLFRRILEIGLEIIGLVQKHAARDTACDVPGFVIAEIDAAEMAQHLINLGKRRVFSGPSGFLWIDRGENMDVPGDSPEFARDVVRG